MPQRARVAPVPSRAPTHAPREKVRASNEVGRRPAPVADIGREEFPIPIDRLWRLQKQGRQLAAAEFAKRTRGVRDEIGITKVDGAVSVTPSAGSSAPFDSVFS